jgi:hypothetical protein
MTLDGSWFDLWTGHEKVWIQADQQLPKRVKDIIGAAK